VKLTIVAVGKLRTDYYQAGCADYAARLARHFPARTIEVKDAPRRTRDRADPARARATEGRALRRAIPDGAVAVALDERGRSWDSRGLARWLGARRDSGVREIAFVVGGPDGLDDEVRTASDRVWSLGPLTLPHELARLVLLEQLYRSATLLAGVPYHR